MDDQAAFFVPSFPKKIQKLALHMPDKKKASEWISVMMTLEKN